MLIAGITACWFISGMLAVYIGNSYDLARKNHNNPVTVFISIGGIFILIPVVCIIVIESIWPKKGRSI